MRFGYNTAMSSLAESNPHLRDPQRRRQILAENAWQSSVFEGANGLPPLNDSLENDVNVHPRNIASTKNTISGA